MVRNPIVVPGAVALFLSGYQGRKRMVNLRSNYPNLREEGSIFQQFIAGYPPDNFRLRTAFPLLTAYEQDVCSRHLLAGDRRSTGEHKILSCISGTAAIFSLLSVLQKTHNCIAVEDFTYSGLLNAASHLQLTPFSLTCDEEGPLPEAVEKAVQDGIRLFYLQPTIHNPANRVMGEKRRSDIARKLKGTGALVIEDDAYRFLHPAPPPRFLQLLPAQTISIISLSKPFHSFVQTCFVVYPENCLIELEEMINLHGTGTPHLLREFSVYLLEQGYLENIVRKKREMAVKRKQAAEELLSSFSCQTFPTSFHLWIQLPPGASSVAVTEALKQQNILITGGHEFSPMGGESYIRIALSAEDDDTKRNGAIEKIKRLLLS